MKTSIYIALALIAGMALPFQAGINAQLRSHLGHPVQAAFVSFVVGMTALLLFLLVSRTPLPADTSAIRWWIWIGGGLLGASYIVLIVVLTPILGVAITFGLIVAGQMLMALMLDHFGWLGFPLHAVNLWRVVGAALIVAGVVLIRRF